MRGWNRASRPSPAAIWRGCRGGPRRGACRAGLRGLALRSPGGHRDRHAPPPGRQRDPRAVPHPAAARNRFLARPFARLHIRGGRGGARARRSAWALGDEASMREFWVSSGHHLTPRTEGGGLAVTDELLLAYLARPELAPPEEACAAERALHASLLRAPRRPVAPAELAA